MKYIKFAVLALTAGLLLSGCEGMCPRKGAAKYQKPAEPAKAEARAEQQPCGAMVRKTMSENFPVTEGGAAVKLEQTAPSEVQVNQQFDYELKVTNLTDQTLMNVAVRDQLSPNVTIKNSTPQAQPGQNGMVTWMLGEIGPKGTKAISVTAVAANEGAITSCARVTYDTQMCAKISVVRTQLTVTKSAPAEALVCDRIPLRYVVTNTGSGTACDIVVRDNLPEGLATAEGKREVMMNIASLKPGESKTMEATVNPSATGTFTSKAEVTSMGTMIAESAATPIAVKQPVLAISQSGPEMQYIGKPATFEVTVANKGDGAARRTVVEVMVPEGTKFENATEGGRFTHSSPGKVTWNVGMLDPGQTRKLNFTLSGQQAGSISTTATAKAYCAEAVSSSAQTNVAGIAGILLEMVDATDPIEVGQNETYTITVVNQGTAEDTNIRVTCRLDGHMEYVSSTWPTSGKVSDNVITFEPLANLAAKGQAKWQVTVRAKSTGDARFRTSLSSEQLKSRPVEESESTTVYTTTMTPAAGNQ